MSTTDKKLLFFALCALALSIFLLVGAYIADAVNASQVPGFLTESFAGKTLPEGFGEEAECRLL